VRFRKMMGTVPIDLPPFERFYADHRDVVLGHLLRKLGRNGAEDAFQETFLRALHAYPYRRAHPTGELPELVAEDGRAAYLELDHLASTLPPTERAAVVLRYGYDLAYDDIAVALGSSAEAARQAASSGVRRLRKGTVR